MKTIPIFIITCDRLKVLEQSIQSYYKNIKTPFEIVIIDFGSTFVPTMKYLTLLQYEGKKIYREDKIIHNSDLNKIDAIIQDYFSDHPASNYVVTDPDIALDDVESDILDVYSYMLERLPAIDVVGPMLRIDDIPDYYPKKQKVISNSLHVDFHSKPVNTITNEIKDIRFIFAPIDTTFAMSRAGTRWMRLKRGIRILAPYSARHLDWYIDPDDLSPDQMYYKEHASRKIAHWSTG